MTKQEALRERIARAQREIASWDPKMIGWMQLQGSPIVRREHDGRAAQTSRALPEPSSEPSKVEA